jgi:hypothetical protein
MGIIRYECYGMGVLGFRIRRLSASHQKGAVLPRGISSCSPASSNFGHVHRSGAVPEPNVWLGTSQGECQYDVDTSMPHEDFLQLDAAVHRCGRAPWRCGIEKLLRYVQLFIQLHVMGANGNPERCL